MANYEKQKHIARHGDAESAAELGKLLCDGWMIYSISVGAGDSSFHLSREIPEPTIESVYGAPLDKLPIPPDFETTGELRPALADELFFPRNWPNHTWLREAHGPTEGPVLILRRKPKPRRWKVEECGQGDGHGAVHLAAGLPPVRIRIVGEVA